MSAIEDIRQSLKSELERLDTLISRTLDSSNTLMNQVIGNYLEHKGKQLRPMLVMLTARLFGGVNDDALTAAASVEILHNASLIHDDVVDDSGRRHGHATINAVWDNHVAVLVGDFFVSNALKLATETEDLRVIRAIADLGKLLSLGEMDQIYNARYHELNDWRLDAIREFAELFGRCFQIKDDIFDYFDSQVIGKPTGNDLREGKVTLPLLYALSNGASPERDEMLSLLREDRVLSDSDIRRLIAFTHENGGVEYAYATMERMRAEAVAILDKFNSPLTSQFISLLDFVIAREK